MISPVFKAPAMEAVVIPYVSWPAFPGWDFFCNEQSEMSVTCWGHQTLFIPKPNKTRYAAKNNIHLIRKQVRGSAAWTSLQSRLNRNGTCSKNLVIKDFLLHATKYILNSKEHQRKSRADRFKMRKVSQFGNAAVRVLEEVLRRDHISLILADQISVDSL